MTIDDKNHKIQCNSYRIQVYMVFILKCWTVNYWVFYFRVERYLPLLCVLALCLFATGVKELWMILFLFVALSFAVVCCEVTVLSFMQTIYSRTPKLHIKGYGFDADEHHIFMNMTTDGLPSLILDDDYSIVKVEDGLNLNLMPNKSWSGIVTPTSALILHAVRLNDPTGPNVLSEPAVLAKLLAVPGVIPSNEAIYMTATNELHINGTGLWGAKRLDLYFVPPLMREVAYDIVSRFPLESPIVRLRLRHGYQWRDSPGPLSLLGIDSGAGPVRLGPPAPSAAGVQVAVVLEDGASLDVEVSDTPWREAYADSSALLHISGAHFNPGHTLLRLDGGLLEGQNYTLVATNATDIFLQLLPGSTWIPRGSQLPAELAVLAVSTGGEFVAVGEGQGDKRGREVATIVARPAVWEVWPLVELYRSHSHELRVGGSGFRPGMTFYFSSGIVEGLDYTLAQISPTEAVFWLMNQRAWATEPGTLYLTGLRACSGQPCAIDLTNATSPGVAVANVLVDFDPNAPSVVFHPTWHWVYQSGGGASSSIDIRGSQLVSVVGLEFSPPLDTSRYAMQHVGDEQITLVLNKDQKWAEAPCDLRLVAYYRADGVRVPIDQAVGGSGVLVARICEDVSVFTSYTSYHQSQSKVVTIVGSGFGAFGSVSLMLTPTNPSNFVVMFHNNTVIKIRLSSHESNWLPPFISLSPGGHAPLSLLSVTTEQAGIFLFDTSIVIGTVVADIPGVVCDDSCVFSFDGVCDDGSVAHSSGSSSPQPDDDLYSDDESDDGYYGYSTHTPAVSACMGGTDCTDCGGVAAVVGPSSGDSDCNNGCAYARDGVCDDSRGTGYCVLGSDCQDCGPVGATNSSIGGISVVGRNSSVISVSLGFTLLAPTLGPDSYGVSSMNLVMPHVYLAVEHFLLHLHERQRIPSVPPISLWALNIMSIEPTLDADRRLSARTTALQLGDGDQRQLSFGTGRPSSRPSVSPLYTMYDLTMDAALSCDQVAWLGHVDCPSVLRSQQADVVTVLSNKDFVAHPSMLMNIHNFLTDAYHYVYGMRANILVISINSTAVPGVLSTASSASPPMLGRDLPSGAFVHWSPFLSYEEEAAAGSSGSPQSHMLDYLIPCSVFAICAICLVWHNYSKLRAWVTGEEAEDAFAFGFGADDEVEVVEEGRRAGGGVRLRVRSVATKPLLDSSETSGGGGGADGRGSSADVGVELSASSTTSCLDRGRGFDRPGGSSGYSSLRGVQLEDHGHGSDEDGDEEAAAYHVVIRRREEIEL